MEQYFYRNCFLDGKKENLHDAKRDSSDIDVLFTWGCQDDISEVIAPKRHIVMAANIVPKNTTVADDAVEKISNLTF